MIYTNIEVMPAARDSAVTPTLRGQFPSRPAGVTLPSRREKVVMVLAGTALLLPPWLMGAWENWSQWATLVLAGLAFSALFVPMFDLRRWPPSPSMRSSLHRLAGFPVFWLGLAMMVYGSVAAMNSAQVLMISANRQWLREIPHLAWLPHSIATPYWPMNAWHALVVIAPAWLATCAAWTGLETERAWRWLLGALAVNGLALAALGMAQRLSGTREIFWFYDSWPGNPEPGFFGPFIYPGHAAAWMALAFGAAAAMLDFQLRRRDPHDVPQRWGWPMKGAWIWLMALVAIILALSLFVKPDFWLIAAGGVTLVGAGLWLVRLWQAGQKRRAGLYALPALAFMAVLLGAIGASALFWRNGGGGANLEVNPRDPGLPLRYAIARTSAVMIKDAPMLGWGPGSFRYVSPFYLRKNPSFTDPANPGNLLYTAHYALSDWVQIPAEWGALGAGLFVAMLAWWARQAWRLRRQLPGESAILFAAVILVLIGAVADYPLYNPAVLVALGLILAMAVKLGEIAGRPRPTLSDVIVVCP